MITLPKEISDQLPTVMKIPEGTIQFTINFEINFFDKHLHGGLLFEQVAGLHYFRLERTDDSKVIFYRSASSVGTQMSVVDISTAPSATKVIFFLIWSPKENKLCVGPMGVEGANLITSESLASDRNFMIDKDGNVNEVGSNIMGIRTTKNGKVLLTSNSYNYWKETKIAISSLLDDQSNEDFLLKTIKANASFVFLVTGFESYCKTRVNELEYEGIVLSWEELKSKINITKEYLLADTASFFQQTEKIKIIWQSLTGIIIAQLDPAAWKTLTRAFKFRHKIAHVSPLLNIVNEEISNENPIFSSNEILYALSACDSVVEKLHAETLKLR